MEQLSPCSTTKSYPCSRQLGKARTQQRRPNADKNKFLKKFFIILTYIQCWFHLFFSWSLSPYNTGLIISALYCLSCNKEYCSGVPFTPALLWPLVFPLIFLLIFCRSEFTFAGSESNWDYSQEGLLGAPGISYFSCLHLCPVTEENVLSLRNQDFMVLWQGRGSKAISLSPHNCKIRISIFTLPLGPALHVGFYFWAVS